MIAPAKASPNESPNDPAAELTLAASLARSSEIGRQRVVVELGHQQAQPDPAMTNGTTSAQPESARGTIGSSTSIPTVSSANPSRTMLLGRRLPAFLPATAPSRTW